MRKLLNALGGKDQERIIVPDGSAQQAELARQQKLSGDEAHERAILMEREVRAYYTEESTDPIPEARADIGKLVVPFLIKAAFAYQDAIYYLNAIGDQQGLEATKINLAQVLSTIGRNIEDIGILQRAYDLIIEIWEKTKDEDVFAVLGETKASIERIYGLLALDRNSQPSENTEVVGLLAELACSCREKIFH